MAEVKQHAKKKRK